MKDRRGLRLVPSLDEDRYDAEAGCEGAGSSATAPASTEARWWTLTDDVSPAELRAFHQLVLEKIKHLPVSALTPELVPMWQAFDGFASRFVGPAGPRRQLAAPGELVRYGLGDDSAGAVMTEALRFLSAADRLRSRLRDDRMAFVEIQRAALDALGRRAYVRALDARDVGLLALTTGHSPTRVSELMGVWEREPVVECATATLSLLAVELPAEDWRRFRCFLLHEIAGRISRLCCSGSARSPRMPWYQDIDI